LYIGKKELMNIIELRNKALIELRKIEKEEPKKYEEIRKIIISMNN